MWVSRIARVLICVGLWDMAMGSLNPTPVVIWHGMGDSCDGSMANVIDVIQEEIPGVYVHCISAETGFLTDTASSFFGDLNQQIESACRDLAMTPELKDGYIGIGFSQGGLFMRGLLQRCHAVGPRMERLISIGGPQNGVGFVQRMFVQAQYLKLPDRLPEYREHAKFLADINCEFGTQKKVYQLDPCVRYRDAIQSLEKMVLFQFTNDTMLEPKETSHFGFFNGTSIQTMEEQALYRNLGLDRLQQDGRLELGFVEGKHMHISLAWFQDVLIKEYVQVQVTAYK
ncbi:hypothetical protein M9434_001076 [Picochlorum sp. BPE23]|nr:hypothetical protein M9434_001076 [Picochlorum sp. BPE23]